MAFLDSNLFQKNGLEFLSKFSGLCTFVIATLCTKNHWSPRSAYQICWKKSSRPLFISSQGPLVPARSLLNRGLTNEWTQCSTSSRSFCHHLHPSRSLYSFIWHLPDDQYWNSCFPAGYCADASPPTSAPCQSSMFVGTIIVLGSRA